MQSQLRASASNRHHVKPGRPSFAAVDGGPRVGRSSKHYGPRTSAISSSGRRGLFERVLSAPGHQNDVLVGGGRQLGRVVSRHHRNSRTSRSDAAPAPGPTAVASTTTNDDQVLDGMSGRERDVGGEFKTADGGGPGTSTSSLNTAAPSMPPPRRSLSVGGGVTTTKSGAQRVLTTQQSFVKPPPALRTLLSISTTATPPSPHGGQDHTGSHSTARHNLIGAHDLGKHA